MNSLSQSGLLSRRGVLTSAGCGFGLLAFSGLSAFAAEKKADPLAAKPPHFTARAKRVIFLCMSGGPSHVDMFDYKPKLTQDEGKTIGKGSNPTGKLLGSPWKFKQRGQSGQWISDLIPETAGRADDLCILRGMQTDLPSHAQAYIQIHTGIFQFKRPSLGAWTLYGLGTANTDLPGFITINPNPANGGSLNYGSAFLPAIYQGLPIQKAQGPDDQASISNLQNPRLSLSAQRQQLDLLQGLNREALERDRVNPATQGMMDSMELAYRMQGAMPSLMDLSGESAATREMYGIGEAATNDYGRQCLLARRFVEAGVRFVQVNSLGATGIAAAFGWDQHRNLKDDLEKNCRSVDKPIAGLLADLKTRGLLQDTLVLWGGEFGRTPYAQNGNGRDHNNKGFTMWMAGGGAKPGFSYGQTDDYGYEAVDQKMHIHDWHATVLHLLGLNHEKLTYPYAGRDMRLTDTKGVVAREIVV
jgi:hypothetical protein